MKRRVQCLVTGIVHASTFGYSDQDEYEQGLCDEFMNGNAWQTVEDDITCIGCLGAEPLDAMTEHIANIDRKVVKATQLPREFLKGR